MTIYFGPSGDRLPNPRLQNGFPFFEFSPRAPLPKASTLRRWRTDASGPKKLSLVAPEPIFKPLTASAEPAPELAWVGAAAAALQASLIVLNPRNHLTTGQRDRDRLAFVCEKIRTNFEGHLCWCPGGLWEPRAALSFSETHDLMLGVDPLERPMSPVARYGTVIAMGSRSRISDGMLERIGDQAVTLDQGETENDASSDLFVAFRSGSSVRDAGRFGKLIGHDVPG